MDNWSKKRNIEKTDTDIEILRFGSKYQILRVERSEPENPNGVGPCTTKANLCPFKFGEYGWGLRELLRVRQKD